MFGGVKLGKPVRSRPWKGSSVSKTRDRAAPSHSGVWYLFREKTNPVKPHEEKSNKSKVKVSQWAKIQGMNEGQRLWRTQVMCLIGIGGGRYLVDVPGMGRPVSTRTHQQ